MTDPTEDLRARYGDVSLESAPVDPDAPGFESLLSALRAVHEGEHPPSLLQRYHDVLMADLEGRRQDLLGSVPAGEEPSDAVRMALGVLGVTGLVLDQVRIYVEEPTPEGMASCVDLLLRAQGLTNYVSQRIVDPS